MARWRGSDGVRLEPPEWYLNFHPEDWDTPDGQEQRMIDGCPSMCPWPDDLHRVHAERRWGEAKHEYRRQHPAFAEQEFADFMAYVQDRRAEPPTL